MPAADEAGPFYPFLQDGRWGYVDRSGSWVIPARFDRPLDVFHGRQMPAFERGKWGFIDRSGNWLVPPICTDVDWQPKPDQARVLTVGKKKGILGPEGSLVLEIEYSDGQLSGNYAWVRAGDQLGLFALDTGWIVRPSLKWPRRAELPYPINQDGVAWFRRATRWGLLSKEGKLLFPPRFETHQLGQRDAEEWSHPDGLDFKNGRAWVREKKRWLLIDNIGRELGQFAFQQVAPWSPDLYRFSDKHERWGLISRDGKIVLPARFAGIEELQDGMAVIVERHEIITPNKEKGMDWIYGCLNARGEIVVPLGKYGRKTGPYSEGLAPAWRNVGGEIYDPRAGYLDREGNEAIPFDYFRTESFSEGLGAVLLHRPGARSSSVQDLYFGFIDRSGAMVIAPQFEHVTPFHRGRAWVAPQHTWTGSRVATKWAMIDRAGAVLTDWAFDPPEQDQGSLHPPAERLAATRWRGDLAVISRNRKLGLATAEGRVLIAPRFQTIGEFKGGMAAACEWDGKQRLCGFVNDAGELVIGLDYTDVRDFDGDVAWVTRRSSDHKGAYQGTGWLLIDRDGKLLSEAAYLRPSWAPATDYYDTPAFVADLACVAVAETYDVYATKPEQRASWGYIDRSGKRVVWHEPAVEQSAGE